MKILALDIGNVCVKIDLVLASKCDVCLLVVVCTTSKHTCLCVASLSLTVVVNSVNICNCYVVDLLYRSLDLKLVGLAVNNKSVTIQLFALNRQLLSYYWLNYNSHLSIGLSSDS